MYNLFETIIRVKAEQFKEALITRYILLTPTKRGKNSVYVSALGIQFLKEGIAIGVAYKLIELAYVDSLKLH